MRTDLPAGLLFEPDHGTLEGIRVHHDRDEALCEACAIRLQALIDEGLPSSFRTRKERP